MLPPEPRIHDSFARSHRRPAGRSYIRAKEQDFLAFKVSCCWRTRRATHQEGVAYRRHGAVRSRKIPDSIQRARLQSRSAPASMEIDEQIHLRGGAQAAFDTGPETNEFVRRADDLRRETPRRTRGGVRARGRGRSSTCAGTQLCQILLSTALFVRLQEGRTMVASTCRGHLRTSWRDGGMTFRNPSTIKIRAATASNGSSRASGSRFRASVHQHSDPEVCNVSVDLLFRKTNMCPASSGSARTCMWRATPRCGRGGLPRPWRLSDQGHEGLIKECQPSSATKGLTKTSNSKSRSVFRRSTAPR